MGYRDLVLSDSPLRYYRMDGATGATSLVDSSSAAQNATPVSLDAGWPISYSPGATADGDGAYQVGDSATHGYFATPTSGMPTGNGAWTLLLWHNDLGYPASAGTLLAIGDTSGTAHASGFIAIESDTYYFGTTGYGYTTADVGNAHPAWLSGIPPQINGFWLLALTYDGAGTCRAWVNGVQVASETGLTLALPTTGSGAWVSVIGSANGVLDEVAIFGTALSGTQLTALYTTASQVPGSATLSAGADAAVTAYGTLATTLVAGANGPYVVTVGGQPVDVEAGTLDFIGEIGQRSQGSFTAKTALGVHWDYGTQLQVVDGAGHLVYNGFVAQDQVTLAGWAGGAGTWLAHAVTTMDMHYLADKRLAYASFLGQTAGAIVRALFGAYLQPEGVTLGPCQDGPLIPQKVWTGEPVSKCLDWLCQQTGYWWQIDANRVLWFLPSGSMPAPYVLDGSQVSQDDKLSVTWGNRQYRNRQFVDGGYDKTGTLTETFHGNGSTRAFTCSYEIAEIASITLDGASQGFDKKGATGQPFYYAVGDATLAQDPGGTLLTSGNTLVVTYKGRYPVRALAQNPDSIAQQRVLEGGGTGYVEVAQQDTTIKTLDAGFTLAAAQLAHYAQSMTVLVWQALAPAAVGIAQGQLLHVNLPMLGLTMDMLVKSVEITDVDGINIWFLVTCLGGPQDVTWQTFFQNLMNQATGQLEDPANVATTTLAVLSQWSAACAWAASFTFTPNPSPTWPGAATYPQTTLLPG